MSSEMENKLQVPSLLHRHLGLGLHLDDQQVAEAHRLPDFLELGPDQSLQWRRYCQILNCRGPRMTGIVFHEGGNLVPGSSLSITVLVHLPP